MYFVDPRGNIALIYVIINPKWFLFYNNVTRGLQACKFAKDIDEPRFSTWRSAQ